MERSIFSDCTAHNQTPEIFLDFITCPFITITTTLTLTHWYCTLNTPPFHVQPALQSVLPHSINSPCDWLITLHHQHNWDSKIHVFSDRKTFIAEQTTKPTLLSAQIIPDYRMTATLRSWKPPNFLSNFPSWYFSLWFFFAVSTQQGCQLQLKQQVHQRSPTFQWNMSL